MWCRLDLQTVLLALERKEAMIRQLDCLLRTYGDKHVRSDQASLEDALTGLRCWADDLGLDFQAALADSPPVSDELPSLATFDRRI
jgi:hypothetical protein